MNYWTWEKVSLSPHQEQQGEVEKKQKWPLCHVRSCPRKVCDQRGPDLSQMNRASGTAHSPCRVLTPESLQAPARELASWPYRRPCQRRNPRQPRLGDLWELCPETPWLSTQSEKGQTAGLGLSEWADSNDGPQVHTHIHKPEKSIMYTNENH